MRTLDELILGRVSRDDMTLEEELLWVDYCFDNYEREGFANVFCSPYDLFPDNDNHLNGKPFNVLGRVKPYLKGEWKDDETDIECLPMWRIQFEDGYTMGAYAEEIIPSEMRANIWRESDNQFLELL